MWYRDMRYPQVFRRLTVGQQDPRGLGRHNFKHRFISDINLFQKAKIIEILDYQS